MCSACVQHSHVQCTVMQIQKHWAVISTLYLGHPFYWRPGIKTSSTGEEGSVSGNNWGNIACLQERATLLREGPESHFIFLPITFSLLFFWIKVMLSWCFETGGYRWNMCGGGAGGGAGGRKSTEMSGTDVTEGITWKKDVEKRGEGDIDGSERVPASEEDGARVIYIYMSEFVCVCVCVCVCESTHMRLCMTLSPSNPTLHAPPCSLHSFLLHFHSFLFSFSLPSLRPCLPHCLRWQ